MSNNDEYQDPDGLSALSRCWSQTVAVAMAVGVTVTTWQSSPRSRSRSRVVCRVLLLKFRVAQSDLELKFDAGPNRPKKRPGTWSRAKDPEPQGLPGHHNPRPALAAARRPLTNDRDRPGDRRAWRQVESRPGAGAESLA